ETALHNLAEARRRDSAQIEVGGEALAGLHGVLEGALGGELEGLAQDRGGAADLGGQRSEGGDPAAGDALEGVELGHGDAGLAPGELALAGQQKGVSEVVEGG